MIVYYSDGYREHVDDLSTSMKACREAANELKDHTTFGIVEPMAFDLQQAPFKQHLVIL